MRPVCQNLARAAILVVAGLLLVALPAGAQLSVEDRGLVVARDDAARTLTLVSGRVLHVPENAVIRGSDGQRLPFAGLRVAESVGGGYVLDGEAMVRYEAQHLLDRFVVREIEVMGIAPR